MLLTPLNLALVLRRFGTSRLVLPRVGVARAAQHAFELDLKAAHHMWPAFNYTVFRPHNVYGPRQNLADKFRNAIGIFINQILRGQPMTIFGDGRQTRSFSYIDDVAPVIASSVLFDGASNEAFFVGVDDVSSVNALALALREAMGVPDHPIQHLDARKEVPSPLRSPTATRPRPRLKHKLRNLFSLCCVPQLPLSEQVAEAYASHDKMRCLFHVSSASFAVDVGLVCSRGSGLTVALLCVAPACRSNVPQCWSRQNHWSNEGTRVG